MTDPFDAAAQAGHQLQADLAAAQQQLAALTAKEQAEAAQLAQDEAELHPTPATVWGSSVWPLPGDKTIGDAMARVDAVLHPQVIRHYVTGIQPPTWPAWTGSHPLVISFKLPPAEVLAGRHDPALAAFFAATPRLTYWSYWHEPEDDAAKGAFTTADYRAAWAHIAAIARSSGKPLKATLILMDWTLKTASRRTWTDYYPGPDVIDVLAWDAYIWTAATTPAQAFDPVIAASKTAGKPWAIAETGVGQVQHPDPTMRAAKLTATAAYLAAAGPVFVTYFDSGNGGAYQWPISSSPAASAAWLAGQT